MLFTGPDAYDTDFASCFINSVQQLTKFDLSANCNILDPWVFVHAISKFALYPLLLFPTWLFISLTTTIISPVARIPSSWILHSRNVSLSGFPECVVCTEKRFTSLLPTTNFTISTRSLCLSRLATLVYPFFCNTCTYIIIFLLNSHPKQFGIVFSTKESTSFIFLLVCCTYAVSICLLARTSTNSPTLL